MNRLIAVLAAALLALASGAALGNAGYVHDMTGTATATTTGGAPRALKAGDIIPAGTTINTGARSNAVIKFEDGQVMSMNENSGFRIAEYRYDKQRVSNSSAVFNILRGGLRFVTGVIGATNRNAVRLQAGTTTIGIRGTDGSILIDAATNAVSLAIAAGEAAITNAGVTQVVGPGAISTANSGQGPTLAALVSAATPAVQAVLTNLALTPIPVNTPTVLAAAADAAAKSAIAKQLAAQALTNPALKAQADQAALDANAATAAAIQAGQKAMQDAINAGGVPPAPPSGTTGPTGAVGDPSTTTTDSTTSTTGTGAAGAGGAGGGGGGSTTGTCGPASTSPC